MKFVEYKKYVSEYLQKKWRQYSAKISPYKNNKYVKRLCAYQKDIDWGIVSQAFFFFMMFVFLEAMYLYYFGITFTLLKLCYLFIYSVLFAVGLSFIPVEKARKCVTLLLVLLFNLLYFAEASYYHLFTTFVLWEQVIRINELAGIKDTISEFINAKFFVFFLPFVVLTVFYVVQEMRVRFGAVTKKGYHLSLKSRVLTFVIAFCFLSGFSMYSIYGEQDTNKVIIKNTVDYVRRYSFVDAFFVNSLEPLLQPFFKQKEPTPEEVEAEFRIIPEINEMTNRYQDKNLVFIEGESIGPYAIDPVLTPTLYKLQTEGYNFDNYYSPRNNTFATEYSLMNSFYLTPEKEAEPFSTRNSLPGLFKKANYSTQAFHDFAASYYGRDRRLLQAGFDAYFGASDLGIAETEPDFPSDVELFENSFQYISNKDRFLAYYITVTAHGGYNPASRPSVADNLAFVKEVYPQYPETIQTYLATAMVTDQGVAVLYDDLLRTGQLQDTVIVFVGDHYPYGIDGKLLQETFGIYPEINLYKVPFIMWDPTRPAQRIDSLMSTVDVLPTIANLFDLDLQYGMGKDVFSSQRDQIFVEWYDFRSYSFLTPAGGYDGILDEDIGNLTREERKYLQQRTYRRDDWNNSEYLRRLLSEQDEGETSV